MQHAIIPIEIITLIALSRPGAYNGLVQSCKRMQQVLGGYHEACLKRWVRRCTRNERFLRYGYQEMKVYTGVCPNGAYHGEYKIYDNQRNKILEVHNYRFGVMHGNWYKVSEYNYKTSAHYENGLLHGLCKFTGGGYRIDLVRTHYVRGKRHGLHEGQYISGGKRFSINYVNGKIDGEAKYYYPDTNRVCCRENWRKGLLQGIRTFYEFNGKIMRQDEFIDGVMINVIYTSKNWKSNPRINMDLYLDETYGAI